MIFTLITSSFQFGFEFLAYLAVATNCALLYLSPEVQDGLVPKHGAFSVFVVFVVFEHALFCVKAALSAFIKDIPPDVQKSLAKQEYRTHKAWRDSLLHQHHEGKKD